MREIWQWLRRVVRGQLMAVARQFAPADRDSSIATDDAVRILPTRCLCGLGGLGIEFGCLPAVIPAIFMHSAVADSKLVAGSG